MDKECVFNAKLPINQSDCGCFYIATSMDMRHACIDNVNRPKVARKIVILWIPRSKNEIFYNCNMQQVRTIRLYEILRLPQLELMHQLRL